MLQRRFTALGALCLAAFAVPAQARITLEFDYTYDVNNFFGGPDGDIRRATLEEAGRVFSDRIRDELIEIDASKAPPSPDFNEWTAQFSDPGTGNNVDVLNLVVPANVIKVYAGGRPISGSTLGIGGPGGYSTFATPEFNEVVAYRGQGSDDFDFGPWGGSITFDSDTTWNFGIKGGPVSGKNDFFSVAVHELGHLMGFSTAESYSNLIDGAGFFQGDKSVLLKGAPIATTFDGHWINGTLSPMVNGPAVETAMDPSIVVGSRKFFTPLDFAGLDDLGWELAIPGDANADGIINIADYLRIDRGAARGELGFRNGDFDGNGIINATDYFIIDSNFLIQSGVASFGAISAVPEPTTLALMLPLGLLALRRRR